MKQRSRKTAFINFNWRNIEGTGHQRCACASWKKHWMTYSGRIIWPQECSIMGCKNPPTVGAHMHQANLHDGRWIVPACDTCNAIDTEEDISFKEGTIVVSASVDLTCEAKKKK